MIQAQTQSDARDGARPRVLIVDDEPFNLALFEEILAERYSLQTALSGESALQFAQGAAPPELILLDVLMPGMTGFEVCRRLKSSPRTAGIPVIFVSGMHEIEDEIEGFELGCVDYIIKPVSAPIVLARVKVHLQLHRQVAALRARLRALPGAGDDPADAA